MSTKKVTIINPQLVDDAAVSPPPNEKDSFRRVFGTWSTSTNGIEFVSKTPSKIALMEVDPEEDLTDATTQEYYHFKQNVRVKQKSDGEIDISPEADAAFHAYMMSLLDPTVGTAVGTYKYTDEVAKWFTPYTAGEVFNLNAESGASEIGVKFEYNYLDTLYEELLNRVRTPVVIPSMYAMLTDSMITDNEYNTLKAPTVMRLRQNIRENASFGPTTSGPSFGRLGFTNQYVPGHNTTLIRDYEDNKYLFPMYAEITFPLGKKNTVAHDLQETLLGCVLTRDVEEGNTTIKEEEMYFSYELKNDDATDSVSNFTSPTKKVDLLDWWSYDLPMWAPEDGPPALPPNYMFVGPDVDSEMDQMDLATPPQHEFTFALAVGAIESKFDSLLRDKRKTFQEMLDGEECYSEYVMFKIYKYRGLDPDTPIQTFHVMNYEEISEVLSEDSRLSFIDTQVKYGANYTYSVTAFRAIVSNRYEYKNLVVEPPRMLATGDYEEREATFEASIKPTIKLVEVPLFISKGKILSAPPLDPEVSFIPYKGEPNKIMFFFNTNTGETTTEAVAMNEAEAEDMAQIMFNQKNSDGSITHKTDEPITAVQIYRVSSKPVGIEDFNNRILTTVSTDVDAKTRLTAGSIGKIVKQTPNKKYYYMFRSLDYHGGLSNPSPIYEIELYNDGGVGYPIIRHYVYDPQEPKTLTKPARKLIQIIPRISQAYLNEKASGLLNEDGSFGTAVGNNNITLGLEEESLFGKKFKVRLTSKSTGKKVDINIDYRTKRVLGEIE